MSTAEAAGALCGLVGGILWLVSGILAVVALGLSPFTDTAFTAQRLSREALWFSLIAIVLIAAATATNRIHRDVRDDGLRTCGNRPPKPWMVALVIGIVPVVAIGARFWSRRTERQTGESLPTCKLRAILVRLFGMTFVLAGSVQIMRVLNSGCGGGSEVGDGCGLIAIGVCIAAAPSFINWYNTDDDPNGF